MKAELVCCKKSHSRFYNDDNAHIKSSPTLKLLADFIIYLKIPSMKVC